MNTNPPNMTPASEKFKIYELLYNFTNAWSCIRDNKSQMGSPCEHGESCLRCRNEMNHFRESVCSNCPPTHPFIRARLNCAFKHLNADEQSRCRVCSKFSPQYYNEVKKEVEAGASSSVLPLGSQNLKLQEVYQLIWNSRATSSNISSSTPVDSTPSVNQTVNTAVNLAVDYSRRLPSILTQVVSSTNTTNQRLNQHNMRFGSTSSQLRLLSLFDSESRSLLDTSSTTIPALSSETAIRVREELRSATVARAVKDMGVLRAQALTDTKKVESALRVLITLDKTYTQKFEAIRAADLMAHQDPNARSEARSQAQTAHQAGVRAASDAMNSFSVRKGISWVEAGVLSPSHAGLCLRAERTARSRGATLLPSTSVKLDLPLRLNDPEKTLLQRLGSREPKLLDAAPPELITLMKSASSYEEAEAQYESLVSEVRAPNGSLLVPGSKVHPYCTAPLWPAFSEAPQADLSAPVDPNSAHPNDLYAPTVVSNSTVAYLHDLGTQMLLHILPGIIAAARARSLTELAVCEPPRSENVSQSASAGSSSASTKNTSHYLPVPPESAYSPPLKTDLIPPAPIEVVEANDEALNAVWFDTVHLWQQWYLRSRDSIIQCSKELPAQGGGRQERLKALKGVLSPSPDASGDTIRNIQSFTSASGTSSASGVSAANSVAVGTVSQSKEAQISANTSSPAVSKHLPLSVRRRQLQDDLLRSTAMHSVCSAYFLTPVHRLLSVLADHPDFATQKILPSEDLAKRAAGAVEASTGPTYEFLTEMGSVNTSRLFTATEDVSSSVQTPGVNVPVGLSVGSGNQGVNRLPTVINPHAGGPGSIRAPPRIPPNIGMPMSAGAGVGVGMGTASVGLSSLPGPSTIKPDELLFPIEAGLAGAGAAASIAHTVAIGPLGLTATPVLPHSTNDVPSDQKDASTSLLSVCTVGNVRQADVLRYISTQLSFSSEPGIFEVPLSPRGLDLEQSEAEQQLDVFPVEYVISNEAPEAQPEGQSASDAEVAEALLSVAAPTSGAAEFAEGSSAEALEQETAPKGKAKGGKAKAKAPPAKRGTKRTLQETSEQPVVEENVPKRGRPRTTQLPKFTVTVGALESKIRDLSKYAPNVLRHPRAVTSAQRAMSRIQVRSALEQEFVSQIITRNIPKIN